MILLLNTLVLALISFFLLVFTGHLILSFLKKEDYPTLTDIFFKFLSGIIFIVCSYSIIKAGFKTYNFSIVLVLTTYFYLNKNKLKFNLLYFKLLFTKQFFTALLIYCISYFIFGIIMIDFNSEILKIYWYDSMYYADLSKGLSFTGIENRKNVFFQFQIESKTEMYHYFDLWLNSFFTKIFKIDHYAALTLITYPVFWSAFFIGFYGLFESFKLKTFQKILLFFIPFAILTPILSNENYLNLLVHFPIDIGSMFSLKLLSVYVFMLAAFISLIEKKHLLFYTYLVICFLSYSTTIIALFPALLIIFIILLIYHIPFKFKKKECYGFITILMIGFFSFFVFNLLFASSSSSNELIQKESIKSIIHIFSEGILSNLIHYFIPLFIFIYISIFCWKDEKLSIIIISILYIVALIATNLFTAIFYGNINAGQSIFNIVPNIITGILIFSVYYLLKFNLKFSNLIFIGLLIASGFSIYKTANFLKFENNILNKYTNTYIKKVVAEIESAGNPKIILLGSKYVNEYSEIYTYDKIAPYLGFCNNVSNSYDIKPLFMNESLSKKENNRLVYNTIEKRLIFYLQSNQITHLICSEEWKDIFKDQPDFILLETDPNSCESFYKYKN